MKLEYSKYTEISPHHSLEGIVDHYRVQDAKLYEPFVFPNYSPIFQGLIFNILPLDDIVLFKKEKINLRHKVYFVGQAISPSLLASSSLSLNVIAVNFTPTGVFQLTGINLNNFTDQIIDAEMVFGDEINELYDKIIESKSTAQATDLIDNFLCLKAVNRKKHNKPCVLMALSILERGVVEMNIKDLQSEINTSSKTLERSFKSEIGMTAKMYQRLLRFNQAKQYIERHHYTDWWDVVVRFGFYDHSHLISEFQFFAGKTPVQYINMQNFGL